MHKRRMGTAQTGYGTHRMHKACGPVQAAMSMSGDTEFCQATAVKKQGTLSCCHSIYENIMRKLFLLALACVAYYAHARFSFSEGRVQSWLAGHSVRAMSGEGNACDDYTSDVQVSLVAQGARGRWEVEGGKYEMCGYLKQASAAFTVLQARTHTRFNDLQVRPGGFPWTTAKVTYTSQTSVSASHIPTLTVESEDTVVLVRTLSGTKIKSYESRSTGGL